jgi:predicted nucleic acid-binding protein
LIVLLDSGPLGLVTNPRLSPESVACTQWLRSLLRDGTRVLVPEIADYEVRRELLRAGRLRGIRRLDQLSADIGYLPLSTAAMRKAAEFWANARRQGQPVADPKALDGDVILAAQAALIADDGEDVVIATTNVGHLARFADARRWQESSG